MTELLEKEGMKRIELPTARKSVTLTGKILSHVHNDTGDRLRWADLALYRAWGVDEGDPETYDKRYLLLYMVGHSLAVHSATSRCNRGSLVTPQEFASKNADAEFLEPCPECEPGWPPHPEVTYRMEVTRYSSSRFLTVEDLFDDLRRCAGCGHRPHKTWTCACGHTDYQPGELSQLGYRLVEKATADREIAEAFAQL